MKRVIHLGQAHAKRAEQVQVEGDRNEVGKRQACRRDPFGPLDTGTPVGSVRNVADVVSNCASKPPGRGAEAQHGKRGQIAKTDVQDWTKNKEPAADDRRQRGDRGSPHPGIGDTWPNQNGQDHHDRGQDQRILQLGRQGNGSASLVLVGTPLVGVQSLRGDHGMCTGIQGRSDLPISGIPFNSGAWLCRVPSPFSSQMAGASKKPGGCQRLVASLVQGLPARQNDVTCRGMSWTFRV